MNSNTGVYLALAALAFAVIAMFTLGIVDLAQSPGPTVEATQVAAGK
ncbi:hypothetical protein [Aminobacter sp. MET-1]|nr:hypothetical protein [Aminobacter sp. MET-1]MCX8573067.1 hypothetical protein [Aminobacter sp. MET-1]